VYFVNEFIPSDQLPDLYGAGAFPINYPNEWDQHLGKTGYGIWLHGTPSYTFNRPPQASDGCVTLSNYDFNHLSSFVDVGNTPVIIADGIKWGDRISINKQRQAFYTLLEQWRTDWESHNIERFLSNYSRDFDSQGKDFEAWAENARLAYADAGKIRIRLSNVSVFAYPDQDLLVTTFRQEYLSDNTRVDLFKRQYWKQNAQGRWKIVYEGSV
jgi:murein L,D-transpeptidase YafK